ncbi:retinal-binding protein [Folsomia candida]|uniref:Retinal-binding protein n=1 Tax=Folsomia candida TaxID=158441 RepID=A0A226F366_FOLCA|nr:retinal-binding protein [Folsomia candida]OXA63864.1 Retinal-binding protein [Folsomia candida]
MSDVFKAAFSSGNEYTAEEKEKLVQFRKNVADLSLTEEELEDDFLIKWLRARYLDLPKAAEMLRASMKWRKENEIDTLLEREGDSMPEEMRKGAAIAWCGISKEGYGTFVVPFGRHDMRSMLEKYGAKECEKFNNIFMLQMLKIMKEEGDKKGVKCTQLIEICDCEGYSYRQMATKQCRDFMTNMQTNMDANYPEILRYAMIINAPKVFAIIFNMLKPIIPKATLEKIDIFGPDPEKWRAIVREKFPVELIPAYWGGDLVTEDDYASGHSIWLQGPADMGPYMRGLAEEDAAFTKVVVAARERFIQEVEVPDKNTILEWKFKSEGHDVGFHLFYSKEARAKKDQWEDIVPLARVDAHTQVQEGSHLCEKEGIYSLVWDNGFSVMKAKTILYQISFVDPAHQENPDA